MESSFFDANKSYCESIESKLKTLNLDCSGFCNAYGYDITTTYDWNGYVFNLRFHKHQSTQNAVIGAQDAIDYSGVEVFVKGLNKRLKVIVKRSMFRRFFCRTEIKESIPEPYFMKFSKSLDKNSLVDFSKCILNYQIAKLTIKNGKLFCVIHTQTLDPILLITEIKKIIPSI